jgi:hypothetical protein
MFPGTLVFNLSSLVLVRSTAWVVFVPHFEGRLKGVFGVCCVHYYLAGRSIVRSVEAEIKLKTKQQKNIQKPEGAG